MVRSEARELGLASMLLCVVMVFLLCNFPAMVVNILEVLTINQIDVFVFLILSFITTDWHSADRQN